MVKKLCIAAMLIGIFSGNIPAQSNTKVALTDFKSIAGNWYGSLTYLDYSSGKPYSMPANVLVTLLEKENKVVFVSTYPDEPKANSTDTTIITGDGTMIDKETVKSVTRQNDGTVIITEHSGTDGNDDKPAIIRHTYSLNNKIFSIKKEVKFAGATDWIKRNEYNYSRGLKK